jgi:hypothetical protein
MHDDDNGLIKTALAFIGYYLLPLTAVLIIAAVIADKALADSSYIIQPSLSFAKDNESALTVILSGLLLFAYMMQYQNQRIQRNIMNRQVNLMKAGYTPILGVSSREWGAERTEPGDNPDQDQANRLFLNLSNSGNSTARDLCIWTELSYEPTKDLDYDYRSYPSPLRRTSDAIWWHSDEGGALAQTEEDTIEFKADPKVNQIERGWFKINRERRPMLLHTALEDLEKAGVKDVEIGFILRYTATTGSEEEIYLGAYEADLSRLKDYDMWMHRAQENKEERAKVIQELAK